MVRANKAKHELKMWETGTLSAEGAQTGIFLLFQPRARGLPCNMKLHLGVSVQCLPGPLLKFTNEQIIWNRCNWHLI